MQAGAAQVPSIELTRLYDERWKTFLKDYGQISDLKSHWEYRGNTHEFVAIATALVAFDWSGGPIDIPLAHVTWKGFEPRKDQAFKGADYSKQFPSSSSFRTTVILPEGEDAVDLAVQPYEVEAGATRYFRTVQRNGNRLETDRGSVTLRPYTTAAEVQAEQANMDRFKNMTATMQVKRSHPDAKAQLFISLAQDLASKLKAADPAKAEAVLTSALTIESDFPALLIDRAGIREIQGNSRGAAADTARFKQLTRINLDNPAQACVSQSLIRHSRETALTMCNAAIERTGNDAELRMRRGYLLYLLNRENEAAADYRTAVELSPSNQKAKYGLGKMLKHTGRAAEGDALIRAALEADPNANEDYRNL